MSARIDTAAGAALVALGAVMGALAQGFPVLGGMAYGPGLFPTIIAGGLMLSGLGILAEARAAARGAGAEDKVEKPTAARLPVVALIGLVAFFALTLPYLGFHIAAGAVLLLSVRLFGGGWLAAAVMAVIGPLVLHFVFYSLLRVPLPWGLLTPVAW